MNDTTHSGAPAAPVPPAGSASAGPVPTGATPYAPRPMLEAEARTWSMLIHVLALAAVVLSGGFLGFVVPLVIWMIFRERSALVDFHGKQNLNLQLTLLVVSVAAVVIGFITVGFGFLLTGPLWLAYGIYALVISIVAAVKASSGQYYRIGFTIPFIK
ncbi:DUF4870 domain-containing protein [uncultured Demequina sp.]|mgnify:FL=1|uniref:DUF4870 domain-containing protein n=1 Tax=uncultured Demequina sp. TaxID=693499 RepID=UPI0025EF6A7B|nr:DUF4870 domain-containing protein [uncultured Demequina sp.]